MSCGFCESIESMIMLDKAQDDRLRSEYWARWAKITYRDLDQNGVWLFAGHTTGGIYPLNFCPECGRRLKWNADGA